jgi:hypothetical protein
MQERDLEYYKIRRDIEPLMEGWATNEEYFEKYHYSKTPDLANKRVLVINHLSSWGFLLREGLIELDFVTRMHAPWFIIRIWESFAPITIEQRDIDPEYGKDFEYLYNAVKAKYPQVSADTKFSFDRVHDRVMKQRASESDKTQ